MRNRILLMLVVSIIGITSAFAKDFDFQEDGYYYVITSEQAKTVGIAPKSSYDYRNLYSGNVTIPEKVTHNGVTYTVTSIEDRTFSSCSSLFSVDIPETVTKIGVDAFRADYSMLNITLPSNLEVIGNMAFEGSGITGIVIPDKVKVIGNMTFSKCGNLSKVSLGKGVTEIQQNAFYDSGNLGEITVNAVNPPSLNDRGFTNWNATIYVPAQSLQAYQNAQNWNRFPNILPIGGDIAAPEASVQISKSFVTPGSTVTLKAVASNTINTVHWTLPETVTLTKGTVNDAEIEVTANTIGHQVFTVVLTNDYGTTKLTKNLFDVVDQLNLENVALNKTIDSFSGSTANSTKETPDFLIDGDTNPESTGEKWCNDATNHWAIIDLQNIYKLYEFKIYDCKAGPEQYDNINNYRIYTSTDKENWTLVVDAKDRGNDNIKDDYVAPTKARYIRFNPYDSHSFTIRVWEFEAYGVPASNNMQLSADNNVTINTGETKNITLKYNLNGDEREADISATAEDETGRLNIGEITDNGTDAFTIPVTANNNIGYADLKLTVNNGGATKQTTVHVTVDTKSAENVLAGQSATVRYLNSDDTADYTEVANTALTDGNTTDNAISDARVSTHENDVWAVFESSSIWSIAKVNVFLPNDNKAGNGVANKDITIYVSQNGKTWNQVKKFADLGNVSGLSYILPEYREAKYLAVVSNVPNGGKAAIAEVQAFEQFPDGLSEQAPVVIADGWNADIIAEKTPAADFTNAVLDDQGWVFFTSDVREEGSLPSTGLIVSTKGNKYQLADFDANNAVVLKNTTDEATLTFAAPVNAKYLSILATSANGTSQLSMKVNYDDGTSQQSVFSIDDWFSDKADQGEALYGLSRIITRSEADWVPDNFDYRDQFRLFEDGTNTDPNKKIVSVTFNSTKGGSYPTIMAVSREKAETTTGISNVSVDNGTASFSVNGNTVNVNAPSEIKSISVYSALGSLVTKVTPNAKAASVNINAPAGLYIVRTETTTNTESKKLVIK